MGVWSRQFATDLTMSASTFTPDHAVIEQGPVFEGLQVIVSLDGCRQARVNGSRPFDIDNSSVYLVISEGGQDGSDYLVAHRLQRSLRVGLDWVSARRNGFNLEMMAQCRRGRLHTQRGIQVLKQPMTPAIKAIAAQAMACPFQGGVRDVYLAGKGLELAATAVNNLLGEGVEPGRRLNRMDIERVHHVRELAIEHYQNPLSLAELARRAGTNTKKLSVDFRQVFGMSVFAFIQRYRLQEAYSMLATGEYSVSEVASFVGYAIPHFSTLFRKVYGFPPSRLAG